MLQVLIAEAFHVPPPAPVVPATLVCQKCSGSGRFIGRNGKDLGECFACKGKGRVANPARAAAVAPLVNDDALRATFDKLRASGLKRIKLRMTGFAVKPAPETGKNAGALYVTEGETYLGKVIGGRFLRTDACTADVADKVAALIADPAAAIKATGIETGCCAICGLELTDPESIARGIGPICAERMA
jgi:hypothetical protein